MPPAPASARAPPLLPLLCGWPCVVSVWRARAAVDVTARSHACACATSSARSPSRPLTECCHRARRSHCSRSLAALAGASSCSREGTMCSNSRCTSTWRMPSRCRRAGRAKRISASRCRTRRIRPRVSSKVRTVAWGSRRSRPRSRFALRARREAKPGRGAGRVSRVAHALSIFVCALAPPLSRFSRLDEADADHYFTLRSCDWGFHEFVQLHELRDPRSGFIVEDKCARSPRVSSLPPSIPPPWGSPRPAPLQT